MKKRLKDKLKSEIRRLKKRVAELKTENREFQNVLAVHVYNEWEKCVQADVTRAQQFLQAHTELHVHENRHERRENCVVVHAMPPELFYNGQKVTLK